MTKVEAGQPVGVQHTGGGNRPGGPPPTALDAMRGYLAAQSTVLLAQLPRLRAGKPEASHRVRVACRRSRSLLRTFRPLIEPEWADELAGRIADFTRIVSPERDIEVVRAQLMKMLENLADESSGAVRARSLLDRMLRRDYALAHEATLAALAGPRFHALADQLALAPETMPVRPEALRPAPGVLYPLVAHTFSVVERRVAALPDPRGKGAREHLIDDPADEHWHRVRIAAKRCRYAAEACVSVAGPEAVALAEAMELLTEELGNQQDASVLSATVLRAAETPRIAAPTGFVLGRLLGEARAGIVRSRLAFPSLWRRAADPDLRTWLDC